MNLLLFRHGTVFGAAAFWLLMLASMVHASTGPVLSIPDRIPGSHGLPTAVPIVLTSHGADISALIFSLDFDQECLMFHPGDTDADGIPDDLVFALPSQFIGSSNFDPADTDGELDVVIADFGPPLATLPDGVLAHLILTPTCTHGPTGILAAINFSNEPRVSFGGTAGQGIPGSGLGGSIELGDTLFSDGFESGNFSAWSEKAYLDKTPNSWQSLETRTPTPTRRRNTPAAGHHPAAEGPRTDDRFQLLPREGDPPYPRRFGRRDKTRGRQPRDLLAGRTRPQLHAGSHPGDGPGG